MNSFKYTLQDSFGRVVNTLRISVTDRCNFRCVYCMPEDGIIWLRKQDLLTYEEIERLVRIAASLGVTKLRLTGGEPLMRKGLHLLIQKLNTVPGIEDIALTTNGFFLEEQVAALVKAGLSRINVSIDSLDPRIYSEMVRRSYLDKVLSGIRSAEHFGLSPIKINVVIIRGTNDNEVERFALLARTKPYIVRFIEFMPIYAGDGWSIEKVVSTSEIIERINAMGVKLVPIESKGEQVADRYRFVDGIGEIGIISSVSKPFCTACNRIRITFDGKLRTCLYSLQETDLKALLRMDYSDEEIREAIMRAVLNKEEGHLINRAGFVRPERTMSRIGG